MSDEPFVGSITEDELDSTSVPTNIFDYTEDDVDSPEVRVISGRDFRVQDNLVVDGDGVCSGDLEVDNLTVSGNETIDGDVEIKGQLTISGASKVKVTKNDVQTIPDSTWTRVKYDDEVYDNLGEWANNRFTALEGGTYSVKATLLSANVQWDAGEITYLAIYVNDALYSYLFRDEVDGNVLKYFFAFGSDDVELEAGDVMDIRVKYTRGASTNTSASAVFNHVAIHKLS